MECEELILLDWSPLDDPARPCLPKAGHGLVMMMMSMILTTMTPTGESWPGRSRLAAWRHRQLGNWVLHLYHHHVLIVTTIPSSPYQHHYINITISASQYQHHRIIITIATSPYHHCSITTMLSWLQCCSFITTDRNHQHHHPQKAIIWFLSKPLNCIWRCAKPGYAGVYTNVAHYRSKGIFEQNSKHIILRCSWLLVSDT